MHLAQLECWFVSLLEIMPQFAGNVDYSKSLCKRYVDAVLSDAVEDGIKERLSGNVHCMEIVPDYRYGSLGLDSKWFFDKLRFLKQSLDPLIRRHLCIVSKDMGVRLFAFSRAAYGQAGAHRSISNEDICQRDAVVDHESRRALGEVVLEELDGSRGVLYVGFVQLLAPTSEFSESKNLIVKGGNRIVPVHCTPGRHSC